MTKLVYAVVHRALMRPCGPTKAYVERYRAAELAAKDPDLTVVEITIEPRQPESLLVRTSVDGKRSVHVLRNKTESRAEFEARAARLTAGVKFMGE